MSNPTNRYPAVPTPWNQPDLYNSETRFSGRQFRLFLPGTLCPEVIRDPEPLNPVLQIPNHWSNALPRQESLRTRHAIVPQPIRTQSSARFVQDGVLERLTKETYNPAPKSQLLRNLSLYYRNQNHGGGQSFAESRDSEDNKDGKRCTLCLEDFQAKETVRVTPCKHMYHEE